MKSRRSMIIAFALPFLIVGGLTVWHWYDYSLKDFHTGRLRHWKEGDNLQLPGDNWEALKIALFMGAVCGTAAGTCGLGIHGLTKLVKSKS